MLRPRFCLRHAWNAIQNPAPATALCNVEAQCSFQQQHRGKLLRKVPPFFHMGVFSLYHLQESSALAPFSSTFPQKCDTSPTQGVLFRKWAVVFVFPGRNVCLDLMNRDKVFRAEHFNAAEPVRAFSEAASHEPSVGKISQTPNAHSAKGKGMCFLREPKDLWSAPSNRVSVSGWDVLGVLKWAGSN